MPQIKDLHPRNQAPEVQEEKHLNIIINPVAWQKVITLGVRARPYQVYSCPRAVVLLSGQSD